MAIPDPATTEWVPIWHPLSAGAQGPVGPTGPQGPQGIPGNAVPHHLTHETGGIDEVLFPSGIKERSRAVSMGEWINEPFNAANFYADSPMVWTVASGNLTTYAYTLIGRTVYVMLTITASTVSGSPNTPFHIKLPGGFTSARSNDTVGFAANVSGVTTCRVRLIATDTHFHVYRTDGANWATGVDSTSISIQFFFQI